jgi:hypothetical protein
MLLFVIYCFLAFKFFKNYKARWIYWVGGMIGLAVLSARTPEHVGAALGVSLCLLIILTAVRWVFLWFRHLYSDND